MKQLIWLFCLTLIFCGCTGCAGVNGEGNSSGSVDVITVATYNAQEFFDAHKDGTEYDEFKKSGNWGKDQYQERLDRLCSVIRELNADIYVFEEIENEGILQDISNRLIGDSWRKNELLAYSCFAKTPGTAIGNAVLSRFPLKDMQIHGLDVRSENSIQPSMRPIIRVTVEAGGKDLYVFANHWKSKSGGEAESEIWRDWQESVLAGLLLEAKREAESEGRSWNALALGDFNRDISDFSWNKNLKSREGNVLLRLMQAGHDSPPGGEGTFAGGSSSGGGGDSGEGTPGGGGPLEGGGGTTGGEGAPGGETPGGKTGILVKSPWIDRNGRFTTERGSYWYNGQWERIDHIFAAGNTEITAFGPLAAETWVNESGHPEGYSLYNGKGFSDHLPLKAVIKMN